jgi:D-tyrosyl-tRNA(Tyr) deacylase
MKVVVQRVHTAQVSVAGQVVGRIEKGLLVFAGVAREDTEAEGEWLARKLVRLRCFEDAEGKMNASVKDVGGGLLVISQFTLFGDVSKGTRPSFNQAAKPGKARALYEAFLKILERELGKGVASGQFGELMRIEADNDGPVTLILEKAAAGEGL